MAEMILEVNELKTYFNKPYGQGRAVDGVSFSLEKGKTLGLVGESGCGKSVTALSILRLVQEPAGKIIGGSIHWKGRDLLSLSEKQMQSVRGREIAMIFQEPMTSLNPVYTVGDQILEAVLLHQDLSKVQSRDKVHEVLKKVGFSDPIQQAKCYPHELSGGMRQRAMIAMALSCEPQLLIADEPTTALDVTIQAQILDLLKQLQSDMGLSLLLITHDLGIVAQVADEVAVMYAGKVAEQGPVAEVFSQPGHPYTAGLLQSLPTFEHLRRRLKAIPGSVPPLWQKPGGCLFHPRCAYVQEQCRNQEPGMTALSERHQARCFFAGKFDSEQ